MKMNKSEIVRMVQSMVLVGYANPAPSQYDLRFAVSGTSLPVEGYVDDLQSEASLVLAAFKDAEHLAITIVVPPEGAVVAPTEEA